MKRDVEAVVVELLKNGTKTFTLEQFDGDEKRFRGAIDFLEDLASDSKLDIVEQRRDANRRVNAITVNISAKEREALEEE
jgi:hypothetical protein